MHRRLKLAHTCWWRASLMALLMLGLVVLYVFPVGSVVWATPQQSPLRQTIPTLTPTPIPSWIWISRPGGNPLDCAPSGMPDFDQKQESWHDPASSATWTHCGPLAVADVIWWLDSRFEPGSTPPPGVSDGYPLLPSFGTWDDHDAQNVVPLVNEFANRLDTNGMRTGAQHLGTDVSTLASALQTYVAEKGLQSTYSVTVTESPTFERLVTCLRRGHAVILLLGFWEWQGDIWVYLGGHYVAVAGVEPANGLVAISDPFGDAFEAGEIALGRSPVAHTYPHAPEVHNEARYVSQDAYLAVTTEGPGGMWALGNYAPAYEKVQNFVGQNVVPAFESYRGDYGGAAITTKMDYAVIVSWEPTWRTLHLPIILKGAQWSP